MVRFRNPVVSTANIADGSITTAKLANDAVTTAKLAALAVTAAELADSAVTATKIANLAVGTAAIANLAVTNAKIASLSAAKITAGTINTGDIFVDSGVYLDGSGVIATNKTGAAVEMVQTSGTTGSIRFRNSGGAIVGVLSAADGYPILGDGSGDFQYQLNSGGDGSHRFRVRVGAGSTDGLVVGTTRVQMRALAGSGGVNIASDGQVRVKDRGDGFFALFLDGHPTTAAGANMQLSTSDSRVRRSTSSAEWKTDIRPWDHRASVLDLTPSLFRSLASGDDGRRVHLGLIAEDARDHYPLGFAAPDGINWNAITAGLLAELAALEGRVAALESV